MAIINQPAAGVSPYQEAAAAPIVLTADANGNTVLANPTAAATAAANVAAANANGTVIVNGAAALNSLIATSRSGVFDGANVTINLEEQNFNTTNQVTSTTNYAEGANGSIQYNNGSNGFAGDAYLTYNNGNVITPGIRTNGYFYGNGAPFVGGGNAAIGNFVFTGDTMSINDDANISLTIQGNSLGNNLNQIIINPTSVDLYAFNTNPYSYAELYLDNGNTEAPIAQIIVDGNSTPQQTWTFAADGTLTLPDGSGVAGGFIYGAPGSAGGVTNGGTGYQEFFAQDDGVFVQTSVANAGTTFNTWQFGLDGNLTLPGNTIAINYANGNRITGNVTFRNEIVIGTGTSNLISGLYLAPSSSSADANMYLRVRGNINDEPTHIHFDTGNNQYYNQFIGDDLKYIQLANTGNIVINSNDNVGNSAQWNFDTGGNLTLPNDATISDSSNVASLNAGGNTRFAQLYWNGNIGNGNPYDGSDYYTWAYTSNVGFTIRHFNNNTSTDNEWKFGIDGNLTLPTGTPSINYANGSPYGGGGAAGLPLANGTSNINIATANGNVTVTANATTWTFAADSTITLPNGASLNDTSGDSVAFGQNAGLTSQAQHAVAIGSDAGSSYQGEDSIAIGYQAGYHDQQRGVAIGYQAGVGGTLYRSVSDAQGGSGPVTTYSPSAPPDPSRLYVASTANIAVSQLVFGNNIQANTVVTGIYPGEDRVDITPNYTAAMSEGDPLTFVGVVIGINDASNIVYQMRVTGTDIPANTFVQSTGCSIVTLNQYPTAPLADGAGLVFNIGQGPYSTAVGYRAGQTFQADGAVAIGYSAGLQNQSTKAVAVGQFAGYSNQSANAVAVGTDAGEFTQSVNAVAVGYKAGYFTQGARAVAIGEDAGFQNQGEDAVAVGQKAGFQTQGRFSVAIGNTAGTSGQQEQSVAIGYGTGAVSQQYAAVAIGTGAASYNQGSTAVAIGQLAGNTSQGNTAVAIGAFAGRTNQGNNSIILNATGADLDQTTDNTFTVKPVRGDSTANLTGAGFKTVYYNSTTGEFAYSTD
jgi:hypothetical protein